MVSSDDRQCRFSSRPGTQCPCRARTCNGMKNVPTRCPSRIPETSPRGPVTVTRPLPQSFPCNRPSRTWSSNRWCGHDERRPSLTSYRVSTESLASPVIPVVSPNDPAGTDWLYDPNRRKRNNPVAGGGGAAAAIDPAAAVPVGVQRIRDWTWSFRFPWWTPELLRGDCRSGR